MTLCYNFKTSALSVNALYDDLTTFTLIPYLDEYNKSLSIEEAVKNAMKELEDLHEDSRPILLGYVSDLKFHITNKDYSDSDEIKVIERFVKDLFIKIEGGCEREPLVPFPEMLVFKCFPYSIDLPLQYGYIVNKYTEIEKYNMYLSDKHQFVVVTELEFDFEEDDILSDEFLNQLNS